MTPPTGRSPASGSFFASLGDRRRWILAFALSIALNEIAIGLLRLPGPEPEGPPVVPQRIVLERAAPTPRPTLAPTPRPTPVPTPPPTVPPRPRVTIAPVPQLAAAKAAGTPAPVHGGAPAKPIHHFKNFDVYQQLAKSALGHAAGIAGTGAGIGTGSAAGGGAAGTGAGNGHGTTGSGAVDANTPCGEVVFNVRGPPNTATARRRSALPRPFSSPTATPRPIPFRIPGPTKTANATTRGRRPTS